MFYVTDNSHSERWIRVIAKFYQFCRISCLNGLWQLLQFTFRVRLKYVTTLHDTLPSTTTHHQPKYIHHHHPPPSTTSQNISNTTHHNPPPVKIYLPPHTTQKMDHHPVLPRIYSYTV